MNKKYVYICVTIVGLIIALFVFREVSVYNSWGFESCSKVGGYKYDASLSLNGRCPVAEEKIGNFKNEDAFCCSKKPNTQKGVTLGVVEVIKGLSGAKNITLKSGETKENEYGKLELVKIEDSRCPLDAQCLWAGVLKATVLLSVGEMSTTTALTIGAHTEFSLMGVSLKAVSATPITKASEKNVNSTSVTFELLPLEA